MDLRVSDKVFLALLPLSTLSSDVYYAFYCLVLFVFVSKQAIFVQIDLAFFSVFSIFSCFVSQVVRSSDSALCQQSAKHKLFSKFKMLLGHLFYLENPKVEIFSRNKPGLFSVYLCSLTLFQVSICYVFT